MKDIIQAVGVHRVDVLFRIVFAWTSAVCFNVDAETLATVVGNLGGWSHDARRVQEKIDGLHRLPELEDSLERLDNWRKRHQA